MKEEKVSAKCKNCNFQEEILKSKILWPNIINGLGQENLQLIKIIIINKCAYQKGNFSKICSSYSTEWLTANSS